MAQPLRRQIFTVIVILTLVVYAASDDGAYLTEREHLGQVAAVSGVSTLLMFGVTFVFGRRWLSAFDHLDDAARESIAAQMDDKRRMREERQLLHHQVIRQERLAAIGVLVSGVAHELNNPLQAILGFAELLQMQKDMPESALAKRSPWRW